MLAQWKYLEIQRTRACHASGKFLSHCCPPTKQHIALKTPLGAISGFHRPHSTILVVDLNKI